ncbi:MAG: hypothetical protein MI784_04110 [Cytophagales bacterium]|nr:hypothetical protein [Cytophagales bacterium]
MFLPKVRRKNKKLHESKKTNPSVVQFYHAVSSAGYFPVTQKAYFEHLSYQKLRILSMEQKIRTLFDFQNSYLHPQKRMIATHAGTGEKLLETESESSLYSLPSLRVADRGDLAVEDTDDKARVFYASEERIEESNSMLKRKKSPISLQAKPDVALAVPDRRGILHFVQLVLPALAGQIDEFLAGVSDCGKFALHVLGRAKMEMVAVVLKSFEGEEMPEHIAVNYGDLRRLTTRLYRIALSERGLELNDLASSVRLGGLMVDQSCFLPQEDWDGNYRQFGIDRYALPDLGELFRIMMPYKLGTEAEKATWKKEVTVSEYVELLHRTVLGLSRPAKEALEVSEELFTKILWNMHNAAVIAQSGTDRVTLENWPFSAMLRSGFLGLFDQQLLALEDFQQELAGFCDNVGENIPSNRPHRLEFFLRFVKTEILEQREAEQDWKRKIRMMLQDFEKLKGQSEENLWGFFMYGLESGQTFYEQQKDGIPEGGNTLRISVEDQDIFQGLDSILRDTLSYNFQFFPIYCRLPEANEELREFNQKYMEFGMQCLAEIHRATSRGDKVKAIKRHNNGLAALKCGVHRRVHFRFLEAYGLQRDDLDNYSDMALLMQMLEIRDNMDFEGDDLEVAYSLGDVYLKLLGLKDGVLN